jgi:hypothetical protein
MVKRNTIAILLIAVIFSSCKKDKQIGSPSVQINAPASLTIFKVFDTVKVSAHVSDANQLTVVSVYIVNGQGTQVLPTYPIPITSNDMTFTISYTLSDIHLASGNYSITVFASNGTNITYGFQQIYINAAPTKREALYAITKNISGVHTSKIDSAYNVIPGNTFSGDYSSSDVSSYYQQLYITAADSGSVNAVSFVSPAWSVPGIISSTPYYTNTYSYGDAVYVSLYSGFVKYYNHSGGIQNVFNITSGFYPVKTFVYGKYLFVEEKDISSQSRNLVLYNNSTAVGFQQAALPGPVIAMFDFDYDHIFVFGNQNSGAPYLLQYSISGNIFYSPIVLPTAKMISADQVDADDYIISFSDDNIYTFSYNPLSMNKAINGIYASHVKYDAVYNHIIAATSHYVKEYNYGSPYPLLNTANLIDSVLNVHILNNK